MVYDEANDEDSSGASKGKKGARPDHLDPFSIMYRHIMEPIMQQDRLEVLRQSKIEFDVKLYPKDLKNLAKKEELTRSRVHLESGPDGAFMVELNLDENFERHCKEREESATKQASSDQLHEDENEEMEADEGEQEDAEMKDHPEPVQKQACKKRRRKSKLLSGLSKKHSSMSSRKPYHTYLPNSLYECTWLENTPKNIVILNQKNEQAKLEREIKREKQAQKLMQVDLSNPEADVAMKEVETEKATEEEPISSYI